MKTKQVADTIKYYLYSIGKNPRTCDVVTFDKIWMELHKARGLQYHGNDQEFRAVYRQARTV